MRKRLKTRRIPFAVLLLIPLAVMLAGCGKVSPPSAMIAYVVGDGKDGHDNRVHNIVYPDQKVSYDDQREIIRYVPSNSRNYIINDGSQRDANNHRVGDRFKPVLAYTKTGTPILVSIRAFWTLNESKPALMKFWELCFKYTCADSKAEGGNANFGTKGWNGMLGENFGPSVDTSTRDSAETIGDDIWQFHKETLYNQLASLVSEHFADEVRKTTGYNVDLFCGSGNSGWPDPRQPGKGEYRCTNVRFVVDDVQLAPVKNNASGSTANNKTLNADRLKAAQALYGDTAGYWLGVQDTIAACKQGGVSCVINLGGTGNAVPVPVTSGKK